MYFINTFINKYSNLKFNTFPLSSPFLLLIVGKFRFRISLRNGNKYRTYRTERCSVDYITSAEKSV